MAIHFRKYEFTSFNRIDRLENALSKLYPHLDFYYEQTEDQNKAAWIMYVEVEELDQEFHDRVEAFIAGFWEGIEKAC